MWYRRDIFVACDTSVHRTAIPQCDNLNQRLFMFVILWQFDILEENVPGFESAYGPDGTWSLLFARSAEYLGTELLRDAYVPCRYVTVDRWRSEEAFRAFRAQNDADYEALDRACDSLTQSECRIGAFVSSSDESAVM